MSAMPAWALSISLCWMPWPACSTSSSTIPASRRITRPKSHGCKSRPSGSRLSRPFFQRQHPARQLIDLMGLFSHRFPEGALAHDGALERVRTACADVLHDTEHLAEAFALAHGTLAACTDEENARAEAALSAEAANPEHIGQQELGRRLALGNLHDLTERYPARNPCCGDWKPPGFRTWPPYT